MVNPGELNIDEQRLYELRRKIQDDSYVLHAIEQIAELMTKELFTVDETVSGGNCDSPFA